MKTNVTIPQHILDDAAQLSPEEFNARRYQIEATNADTGKKHLLTFRIVGDDLRLYLLP